VEKEKIQIRVQQKACKEHERECVDMKEISASMTVHIYVSPPETKNETP